MAKKKKTRKKSKTGRLSAALTSVRQIQWARMRPYVAGAAWIAGLGVLVAALMLGVPRLRQAAAAQDWTEQVDVQFTELPPWVDGDLLALLEITAQRCLAGDPLDQERLALTRAALLNTGWFDSIEQVRRLRSDEVLIDGRFVTPFAVIRDADGDHLVDPHGRLLPCSYRIGEAPQFITVIGAHFDRPLRPGLQWDGADVTAALRLLRLVHAKSWRRQIESIDASTYLTDRQLVILTDRETRIVWGRAPGDEAPGEALAERKLFYLETQFNNSGRIDRGHPGELDVTSTTGVYAR